ncbi:diaminopimelate epimerase, partial [Pseudomonas sp. MWU13-2860]
RQLGDRHFGIGFDQLLLVEAAQAAGHDFRYRIFNNDGGEVEQCGNGARCFAKFVSDRGLTSKSRILVETAKGVIAPEYLGDGQARVDMGRPRFAPAEIPFQAESEAICDDLQVGDAILSISVVSMGNPHAVQVVADVALAPVTQLGAAIENHPRFPQRV